MKYRFRRMLPADLPEVVAIERAAFPTPWSADLFRHELTVNQVARYFVGCRGGDVVGYAGFWLIVGEIHLTTIAVRPEERSQGIGEWLLISLIEEAQEHDAQCITLEVRQTNLAALRLYSKYGFAQTGRRPGYYSESGEDAVLMSVDIDSVEFRRKMVRWKQVCLKRLGQ